MKCLLKENIRYDKEIEVGSKPDNKASFLLFSALAVY